MATDILDDLSRRIRTKFEEDRQGLSFSQYLEFFQEAPRHHGRSVAQYLRDMSSELPGTNGRWLSDQAARLGVH